MNKKSRFVMLAAILTICGTMVLTSCTNEVDNPVVPVQPEEPTEQDVSNYSVDQIKSEVQGNSVDPVMFVFTNHVKLYDLDADGKCNVYDLLIEREEESEDNEVGVTQYSGTWKATNDLSRLHFVEQLDLEGYDLMGGLMLHTQMQMEGAEEMVSQLTYEDVPNVIEVFDTLAVLRDQEDGELLFFDKDDVNFLVMLDEMGILSSNTAATRAPGFDDKVWKAVEDKVKDITVGETYRTFVQPYLNNVLNADLSDWMGNFYKNLNPRIADVSIVGANWAPSYAVRQPDPFVAGSVKTQFWSFERMWKNGVRYFDLGTCIEDADGELYFYNYDWNYKIPLTLKKALTTLKDLMEKHPGETAILMFDYPDGKEDYKSVIDKISALVQSELKDRLINFGPEVRLNECRGKFLLMNRFTENSSNSQMGLNLRAAWKDNTSNGEAMLLFPGKGGAWFRVYANKVLDPNKPGQAKEKRIQITDALDRAAISAKNDQAEWCITHVAGCYKYPTRMDYSQNALYQNKYLTEIIHLWKGTKTGIVVMDYVGSEPGNLKFVATCRTFGQELPTYITGNNFFLVKDHKIQLASGDSPD